MKKIFAMIFLILALSLPAYAIEKQAVVTFGLNVNFSKDRMDDAITAIGSAKASMVLRYGTWNLDSNLTIPTNISFSIPPGATITGAYTLTINGPFSADPLQVFGSTLTVVFGTGSVRHVYPEWFGETVASLTRTRASIAVSAIPMNLGKVSADPDTTGWGTAEAGTQWYYTPSYSWKWWDGTQIVSNFRTGTGFIASERTSITNPPSGYQGFYPKSTDGRWYTVTSAGTETQIPIPGADADYYYLTTRTASGLANSFSLGTLTTGIPLMTVSGGNATLSSLGLVTTIGPTGYDTNIGSEKAVRDAISNAAVAVIMDEYTESNYDTSYYMAVGYASALSQSFTANGYPLNKVKWYLKKVGDPTGNIYSKIYAHTGTYGTSSLPSGTPLATSDAIDVSTISTSFGLVEFTFSTPYPTGLNTQYVATVEYAGPNNSNCIMYGYDDSAPTHAGNMGYKTQSTGNWAAMAVDDMIFYAISHVYGGGGATITWGGILGSPEDQADMWALFATKPTAALVTTLGDPGVNTNVPSEKAVRDAIDAIGGGTMVYPGAGIGVSTGSAWGTSLADPLTTIHGGTGKASWTQYAIPYASATTTLSEIPIGAANYYLKVNANATGYTYGAGTGTTNPGGSDKAIQFNYSGAFGGSNSLSWDYTNNILTMKGANAVDPATFGNASLGRISGGSAANPITTITPMVSITRREAIYLQNTEDGHNPALYVESVGNNTSTAHGGGQVISQVQALTARGEQLGSGDSVGLFATAFQSGASGYTAYAGFFAAYANVSGSQTFTTELASYNNTGADVPYSSDGYGIVGIDNIASGANLASIGMELRSGGAQWDVGVAFLPTSIKTASIIDDSSSVTVLKANGAHTYGIDLYSGTFSGAAIRIGDNYTTGKLAIGNYGSYLGRQTSDGSIILHSQQADMFLNTPNGYIAYGTYVGTPGTITGYIYIKDSGGNLRKLAVTN